MADWKCGKCGWLAESERCPDCHYSYCTLCHMLALYGDKPPKKCPSCKQEGELIDLDVERLRGGTDGALPIRPAQQ
jgi:hypothetical protein